MRLPVFEYDWQWNLPATPDALWPLASDTDRFNEDTGLPPVEDARAPGEELSSGRRRLRFSVAGLTVEWEELPFEWVQPRRFGVVRRYYRGPLDEMRVRVRLDPDGEGGTDLRYRVEVRPSNLLGLLLIPPGIGLASRLRFRKAYEKYAEMAGKEEAPSRPPASGGGLRGRKDASRLVERLENHEVGPELARLLVGYVLGSDDRALQRIRPYALADLWSRERRRVLVACLRATRAGVLDLHWNILCPLCRGSREQRQELRELTTGTVHCDTCLIDFSVDLDRAVEVVFRPAPDVRDIAEGSFCVAGPQITPHVAAQLLMDPGEERRIRPDLDEGRHRIRTLDASAAAPLAVEADGAGEATLRYGPEGWRADTGSIRSGATLEVKNDSRSEILAVLERTAWTDEAATAAAVTALQEFRDLFSEQLLATGEFLSVGSLAVLFTDLKGSTRMYRSMGDAPAYDRVRSHFGVLRAAIEPEEGAVVKTLGDAVMAVFQTRAAALRSLRRAHAGLRDLAADRGAGEPLTLKAGLAFGPCLTVTMNERLDYFGTTVNVAARLTDLSTGGDVVVPGSVLDDPGTRALLDESPELEVRPLESTPRGLDDLSLSLFRVLLHAGPEPEEEP